MAFAARIRQNLQRWLASVAPLRAGDLGMDVATGRPRAWVGGADQSLAVLGDLVINPYDAYVQKGLSLLGLSSPAIWTTDWFDFIAQDSLNNVGIKTAWTTYTDPARAGAAQVSANLITINADGESDTAKSGGVLHLATGNNDGELRLWKGTPGKNAGVFKASSNQKFYYAVKMMHVPWGTVNAASDLRWGLADGHSWGVFLMCQLTKPGANPPLYQYFAQSATTDTFTHSVAPTGNQWQYTELYALGDGKIHMVVNGTDENGTPQATSWGDTMLGQTKRIQNGTVFAGGGNLDGWFDWEVLIVPSAT